MSLGWGGQALRVQNLTLCAVHTLFLVLEVEDVSSQFLGPATMLAAWLLTVMDSQPLES